jgi:hypothetical protein
MWADRVIAEYRLNGWYVGGDLKEPTGASMSEIVAPEGHLRRLGGREENVGVAYRLTFIVTEEGTAT